MLEVGAEGGNLKILRRAAPAGGWEYSAQLRDQSLMLLDRPDVGAEIRRDFGWVSKLEAALRQLNQLPWPQLKPIRVHPDARKAVLSAAMARLKKVHADPVEMNRWQRLCAPEPTPETWPELTYRYVEFYFWEPQHIRRKPKLDANGKPTTKPSPAPLRRHLRHDEVPLNYLLNVLLRLAPASVRAGCLSAFKLAPEASLAGLRLKNPGDYGFVQPDVHLESKDARVFIELKIEASLTLKQVEKYVRLHKQLGSTDPVRKQQYLLFLVKTEELVLHDHKKSLAHDQVSGSLASLFGLQSSGVSFGSATWSTFAQVLRTELTQQRAAEAKEMLEGLVGDFLADLRRRGLADPPR